MARPLGFAVALLLLGEAVAAAPADAGVEATASGEAPSEAGSSTKLREEEWAEPPSAPLPPPTPPGNPPPEVSYAPRELVLKPSLIAQNRVSAYGGTALGPRNVAVALFLGFPLLGVRGLYGLTPRLDLGVQAESFYFEMNDFRAVGRYQLTGNEEEGLPGVGEGGVAFFARRPFAEGHGARWLTGRRNYNAALGVVGSVRVVRTGVPIRFFGELKYHLALDTEPTQSIPLTGAPAAIQVGHNLPFRAGAELPFSASTSFLFTLGIDYHAREGDSTLMPTCTVGVVTGF